MTRQTPAPRPRGYGALTFGAGAALVAATGRPEQDTLTALVGWGVPQGVAIAAMYTVPVVLIVAAMLLGRAVARGRPSGVRWLIYGGFGAVAGFVLGLCLELFAGVPELVAWGVGPLAEPSLLDLFLWVLAGFCLICGLMVAAIAAFGQPAVSALQVEETDSECLEVRRAERAMFAWSALAVVTLGLASGALAIARQAGEEARLAPAILAAITGLISVAANYRLWRGFDELQRRHVVEGYATSAVVITLGAFAWALLQTLGHTPELDATGVYLALVFVQLVATSYVTTSVMGQSSILGKPA